MKRFFSPSVIIGIVIVFIVFYFISRSSQPRGPIPSSTLPGSAPRSLNFDNITPFALQPTPLSFSFSLSSQPSFPTTLPAYSLLSTPFVTTAKIIAQNFSFSGNPTVLSSTPDVFRWNNNNSSLLLLSIPGTLEYMRLASPLGQGFISQTVAETQLNEFLSDKKLLPEHIAIKITSFLPLSASGTGYSVAQEKSANAAYILASYTFDNLLLFSTTYPLPALAVTIDSAGIQKLSMLIPPTVEEKKDEIQINSSSLVKNIQTNNGKVVLVVSPTLETETNENFSLSAISVTSLETGFVWNPQTKLLEPAFLASGKDYKNNLLYYVLPNTP